MRGIIHYHGEMFFEDDDLYSVVGEMRQYFHSAGAVTLDAMCFSELSSCSETTALVESAESRIRSRLKTSGVGQVLPEGGECSIDSVHDPLTNSYSDVAMCMYSPATILSLTRQNVTETRQALRAVSQDPEMQRVMREMVQEAYE